MESIDLNCDLGEGGGLDEQIMPLISSCNIACGGHYGTARTMSDTIRLAQKYRIKIGAHPSYPDKKNFGRGKMSLSLPALKKTLNEQLINFMAIAEKQNAVLHHIKPHGTLYHDVKQHAGPAKMLIETIKNINSNLTLYVPPQSVIKNLAAGEINTWDEGFGDRKYGPGYELLSRKQKDAVFSQKEKVLKQVLSMVIDHRIPLEDAFLPCNFQTICLHSDTPNCLAILRFLNHHLPLNGIRISSL